MQLSVIVCTYNYGHFLPDCLRSLADQTRTDFELLIVDDGSTDNTQEVVREYSCRFERCLYLAKDHSGLADSRNYGVHFATGSHIAFLDADDIWSPRYLEILGAECIRLAITQFMYCDGVVVDGAGNVLGPLNSSGLPRYCNEASTTRERIAFFSCVTASAMVFTREAYQCVGPFDSRYPSGTDDINWIHRATTKLSNCIRLDDKLVVYRRHGRNQSENLARIIDAYVQTYNEVWKGTPDEPEVKPFFISIIRNSIRAILTRGTAKESRQLLVHVMKNWNEDKYLRVIYALCFVGLCGFVRAAKRVKTFVVDTRMQRPTLDLRASAQVIFDKLQSQGQQWS